MTVRNRLTQTASSSTLLFTLTAIKSGTGGTANTARVATYTPDTALQDTASHSIGANLAASPSEVQF